MAGILIIDDNERVCRSLERNFRHLGYLCRFALNSGEAMKTLDEQNPDAVILDLALGDENGLEVLQQIQQQHPQLPVIMITGFGTIETAVNAMKLGAYDYLRKPVDFERLLSQIKKAIELTSLKSENQNLKKQLSALDQTAVYRSDKMKEIYRKASSLAQSNLSILISGEPGSGKEILASFIHKRLELEESELIQINCGSIEDHILQDEIRAQLTKDNNPSTLYIKDLEQVSIENQKWLLREINENPLNLQWKLIVSVNSDPQLLYSEGRLESELYTLLASCHLNIPPLRERKEDIPSLVNYFCSFNDISGTAPEVLQILSDYNWPGNIQELKTTISAAAAVARNTIIEKADLPIQLTRKFQVDISNLPPLEAAEKRIIISTLKENNNNKKKTAEFLNISRKTLYNKLDRYGIKQSD